MKLSTISMFMSAVLFSTSAYATSGGYSSNASSVPTLAQTNLIGDSGNFGNLSGSNGSAPITSITANARFGTTTQGTFQSRLCTSSDNCMTTWVNGYSINTTFFNGLPASTVFRLQVRVLASSTVLLNPKVSPTGQSSINVNYTY